MRQWFALAVQFLALVAASIARSSTGDAVLVVLEEDLPKENFSIFFKGLEERGFELTFRDPKAATPLVVEDDVPHFAHVILFAPTTKSYASDLQPQALVRLLENNVNILFALSPSQTPLTAFASEFSLILPPPHTPLLTHFPLRDTPHIVVPVEVPSSHSILSENMSPVLFSGIPHSFAPNPLLVPILHAPPESFAADTDTDLGADALVDAADRGGEGLWAGSSLGLVSGFQTRSGGARAVWAGGVDVFADAFAKRQVKPGLASGNEQFCRDVAMWTFQEINVLKIDRTTHHHASGVSNSSSSVPDRYTVKDLATYTTHISKWDPVVGEWVSYSGLKDLQLEFTMLDPHIRTSLSPAAGQPGTYSSTFRIPDRHGVFKFVLNYKRRGWTFLQDSITVPVVPPRHDGYPRFLSAAWPYYAGAISTSGAFVIFCTLWLSTAADNGKQRDAKGKSKKE